MTVESGFAIQTRQKADSLFPAPAAPLAAGASHAPAAAEVDGYVAIAFLISSDQPFTLTITESCSAAGKFVRTALIASTFVNGTQQLCTRFQQCGAFMKVVLKNSGIAMQSLQFCAQGIPA